MKDHPKIKEIMSKTHGHARKRTVHVYELCKGKKICEGGDEIDEKLDNGGEGEVKKVRTGVHRLSKIAVTKPGLPPHYCKGSFAVT